MALDIGQAWSVGPGFLRGLRRSSRRGRAICITLRLYHGKINQKLEDLGGPDSQHAPRLA